MVCDTRGGHNRKLVDETFFKSWSPSMAYILGLLFSDGALIDASRSSRTQYFTITSKDYDLLEQVRTVLHSTHSITSQEPHLITIRGKRFFAEGTHRIRIGNSLMCNDLIDLGLQPHKSLVMQFPRVPEDFLPFFVRGYFDGDGCVSISRQNGRAYKMKVVFISGSRSFLKALKDKLRLILTLAGGSLSLGDHSFHLQYGKHDGMKILNFIYSNLTLAPLLDRKYKIYQECVAK